MAEAERTIEDRVANALGVPEDEPDETVDDETQVEAEAEAEPVVEGEDDPEPDEDKPDEEPDGEEFVELEIDGELLEVPKKYQDYFLRQKDYTEKTQKLAADRKQVEVNLQALQQQHEQYEFAQSVQDDMLKIQQLDTSIEQARLYLRNNVDNLTSLDIEKWRMAIEDGKSERDKMSAELQRKSTEFQQSQEQAQKELLGKRTEILKGAIPGWGEDTEKQLSRYAIDSGYTEQEIDSATDPRIWVTLWKSQQFDALKSGAKQAVKKVGEAPKIRAKPRDPMPADIRRKLDTKNKLKRKGLSAKDKARLIQEEVADRLGLQD